MSFKITQGLFQFDFTDHYAVLGVPLDAQPNPIRKRYMQIARRLHPDSCKAETPEDQKLASNLLAKLVSPAYNQLTKDRDRAEYTVILKTMAKRLVQEKDQLKINSESAKKLLTSQSFDEDYKKALEELANQEYESFSKTLEIMGQISELNLVYLVRKQSSGQSLTAAPPAAKPATPAATPTAGAAKPTTPAVTPVEEKKPAAASAPKGASKVDKLCDRAEEFMKLENFAEAVVQLKEAIKLEPKNSKCHGLLGMVYLKQNQASMAKVHISQALKLNPQEPVALKAKKELEKPAEQSSGKSKDKAGKQDKSGGGLFGLFGKKK